MCLWFLGSHRSRCLWFLAHTDPTDLTDFFVGGKSHRIVWRGSGWFFGLTRIPRISLNFFVGVKSHRIVWRGVRVVFGLTQIPRISLNCIDDVKSHRIVWWESGMFF